MFILGLTGSIGMGKSTAAGMLRRLGVPVYDSDAVVHRLLGSGGAAVTAVAAAFPDVVRDGAVDRKALGRIVFASPEALERLEAIVHPMVRRAQREFLAHAAMRGADLVVLDIPLLYETGNDRNCDAVAVVSAPAFLQRQRVLARPGMTAAKFAGILAQQVPDTEKRRRADYVIPTNLGRGPTYDALRRMVGELRGRRGRVWPYGYSSDTRRRR